MKFVFSCCVVSKQVAVSTILVSVESKGPWLHAGTCPVLVCYVLLEILHNIVRTHLLYINQLVYYTERDMEYRYIPSCAGIIFGTPGTARQSCGIAKCLCSFLSALECLIIHVR